MPGDDPTELFDLCDRDGNLVGKTKARGLVHRDGDWHRSLHIWVVLFGETPGVLFQRRSPTKDTHPSKVDVSVAGHLRAGETVDDALREAQEEIGLRVRREDVVTLGTRRRTDDRPPLHRDREVQHIFLTRSERTLESLRPDPHEVTGLLLVPLPATLALVRGEVTEVRASELRQGEKAATGATLTRDELVPDPDDYFRVALESIAVHLAGKQEAPWMLG